MLFTHVKKIQVQKTYEKYDIPNLPTCVVVRNKVASQLPTLTASLELRICYFNMIFLSHDLYNLSHMCEIFQSQKIHKKIVILYLPM